MAKIGLNYGEKLQIADKTYRVITDGLDVPQVLGKLTFRGIEGPDIIFEEDRTKETLTVHLLKLIPEKSVVLLLRFILLNNIRHFSLLLQICPNLRLKILA